MRIRLEAQMPPAPPAIPVTISCTSPQAALEAAKKIAEELAACPNTAVTAAPCRSLG